VRVDNTSRWLDNNLEGTERTLQHGKLILVGRIRRDYPAEIADAARRDRQPPRLKVWPTLGGDAESLVRVITLHLDNQGDVEIPDNGRLG
jgi:hypothetical protein